MFTDGRTMIPINSFALESFRACLAQVCRVRGSALEYQVPGLQIVLGDQSLELGFGAGDPARFSVLHRCLAAGLSRENKRDSALDYRHGNVCLALGQDGGECRLACVGRACVDDFVAGAD